MSNMMKNKGQVPLVFCYFAVVLTFPLWPLWVQLALLCECLEAEGKHTDLTLFLVFMQMLQLWAPLWALFSQSLLSFRKLYFLFWLISKYFSTSSDFFLHVGYLEICQSIFYTFVNPQISFFYWLMVQFHCTFQKHSIYYLNTFEIF